LMIIFLIKCFEALKHRGMDLLLTSRRTLCFYITFTQLSTYQCLNFSYNCSSNFAIGRFLFWLRHYTCRSMFSYYVM
jgi:hypothetical protein